MTLTYAEVGATRGALPSGYRHVRRSRVLHRRDLDDAADDLFTWQAHRRAGLRTPASTPRVADGVEVESGFGVGPLRVRVPCRVVYVIDEPDRRGFAYGTLPGHPETGEEAFVIDRAADRTLTFTITAFSRPATWYARLGGPVATFVQDRITDRYLRALDRDSR
ncbi:DUF1990 family protein [Jatrophihabitans fulvus]